MYFRADLMTQVLDHVQEFGGSIIECHAIEDGKRGYNAKVLDPYGNAIGFWAAKNE